MRLSSLRYAAQRGLSLVELMVGITVGLIVAAGASMLAVNQINEHRRLMLEVQIQQDLRAAADLLQQDLRRAGYRGFAQYSVWQPASGVGTPLEVPERPASASPYSEVAASAAGKLLTYSYSSLTARRDDAPLGRELYGIRWNPSTKVLYLKLGVNADGEDNWQPITDPASVEITNFNVNVIIENLDLSGFCEQGCTGVGCPLQQIRSVSFTISGRAKHDANIARTLTGRERIRADAFSGACPA